MSSFAFVLIVFLALLFAAAFGSYLTLHQIEGDVKNAIKREKELRNTR